MSLDPLPLTWAVTWLCNRILEAKTLATVGKRVRRSSRRLKVKAFVGQSIKFLDGAAKKQIQQVLAPFQQGRL